MGAQRLVSALPDFSASLFNTILTGPLSCVRNVAVVLNPIPVPFVIFVTLCEENKSKRRKRRGESAEFGFRLRSGPSCLL